MELDLTEVPLLHNQTEDFYIKNGVKSNKLLRMCFPIDINLYKECYTNKQELRYIIRSSNDISNNEIVACVVGKLVSWKNQDHIIEAMMVLEKQNIFIHHHPF